MALESADRLVTVVGASGFIGRYVVQELCRLGVRVRAVCRNAPGALFLKPLGDLGQIQVAAADISRPESLKAAVAGSDAVINLVGILKGNFESIQSDGAAALARAARDAGAGAFVQVSAIGEDLASPSRYGRTKAEGEKRVREAFPSATIIRPSIVFGPEDNFINRFARMVKAAPIVPLIRPNVRFQPIWVNDVARAIALAAVEPENHGGKTYELAGPHIYAFHELVKWIAEMIRAPRKIVPVPDAVGSMIAAFDFMPGAPITRDQWLMLSKDNVASGNVPGLEAFSIVPTPLEVIAPTWLVQYRRHGRFNVNKASVR